MLIDTRKTTVYGHESPASIEILIALMVGRIEKDPIPPVKVFTFDSGNTYHLPFVEARVNFEEGGHYRSLSAHLLGEQLEIEVITPDQEKMQAEIPYLRRITLENIRIVSNPCTFNCEKNILKKYYRELPTFEELTGKYSKAYYGLKYGSHKNYAPTREQYESILAANKQYESKNQ